MFHTFNKYHIFFSQLAIVCDFYVLPRAKIVSQAINQNQTVFDCMLVLCNGEEIAKCFIIYPEIPTAASTNSGLL